MTLSVLIAICLFACAFYLFVLFQWMRDKKHAPKSRPAIGDESGKGRSQEATTLLQFPKRPQESVIGAPSNRVGQDSDPAVDKEQFPAVLARGLRTRESRDHGTAEKLSGENKCASCQDETVWLKSEYSDC